MFVSPNKFMHMIRVGYTNIQAKIKINDLLSNPFTLWEEFIKGAYSQCCSCDYKVLEFFIDANMGTKRVQIGDHEKMATPFSY